MIRNWRRDWKQGDFPFLLVQLAPFMAIKEQPSESAWAELREAQALATKALPNVGMAVITDVGDEKDIHPKKKEPVGARLAIAARAIAYDEDIVHSGPTYKGIKVKDGKAIVSFNNVGGGLEVRGDELMGFSIAGVDKKFVAAKAEIQGNKVVVSSPDVSEPAAVRYGWADYPVVNLWNKDGLPAGPFRTDDFPMITKK
jgi:sialate O-acetylesterase